MHCSLPGGAEATLSCELHFIEPNNRLALVMPEDEGSVVRWLADGGVPKSFQFVVASKLEKARNFISSDHNCSTPRPGSCAALVQAG